jgi:CheY-like chemotaxis protein
MAMLLTLEGYKMVAAATRDEALQQINERGVRPDLILCDFNLPMGFTGDEIVSEITLALGYKPPTIMLTGDIADQHVKKARRVAERILPKPVDIALLLRDMTELLGQGAVGEEFAVYAREISVERPLETRCDGAFAELLTSSHLHLLEDHPHTVYGVWSDLTLAYVNPAWFAFARRNGADQSIPGGWSIGRSTIRMPSKLVRVIFFSRISHRRFRPTAARIRMLQRRSAPAISNESLSLGRSHAPRIHNRQHAALRDPAREDGSCGHAAAREGVHR